MLEQHNPEVQFDWTRILKQPASAEPIARQARPSPRNRRDDRSPAPRASAPIAEYTPPVEPAATQPPDPEAGGLDAELEELELEPPAPRLDTDPTEPAPVELRPAAVSTRVGPEGLARLRARYAEVMARIAERPFDEPVREELTARAERLNPDAWVTDDEVREGLEQYEVVFESLRPSLGHPRRRRRRG